LEPRKINYQVLDPDSLRSVTFPGFDSLSFVVDPLPTVLCDTVGKLYIPRPVDTVNVNNFFPVLNRTLMLKGLHGLYIRKSFPWGKYQPMSCGGKNMKRGREKGGKCKRKRTKRGKRKKGEEKENRGSKRVKKKSKINAK
jgi:hypothetical protein